MQRRLVMTWHPEGFVAPDILTANGIDLDLRYSAFDDEEAIAAAARDADAVISAGEQRFSGHVLSRLERCRLVCAIGAGYDGIDLAAASDLGICAAYNPRYCVDEIAEHALALVFAFVRRLVPLHEAVKAGKWTSMVAPEIQKTILTSVHRLNRLTLGIVGFGNTGSALAQRARALGMRVIVYTGATSAAQARQAEIPVVPLGQLLRESDFVSLHAALTGESQGLIGAEELRLMKRSAYIINTARGKLIDQAALVTALSQGWIAGAGLDVMDVQPLPLDSPLLQLNNVILTPHAAYYSTESEQDLFRIPFEEVVRVLEGYWPSALLNPSAKEAFIRRWGPMREAEEWTGGSKPE